MVYPRVRAALPADSGAESGRAGIRGEMARRCEARVRPAGSGDGIGFVTGASFASRSGIVPTTFDAIAQASLLMRIDEVNPFSRSSTW